MAYLIKIFFRKIGWIKEPVAWTSRSPYWNALDSFLWDCMKLRLYRGSKPEGRLQ